MNRYSMTRMLARLVGRENFPLFEALDESILEMVSRAKPVHCRSLQSLTLTGATSYSLSSDFLDYQGVLEPIRIAGKPLCMTTQGESDALESDPDYSTSTTEATWWYEVGVSSGARKIAFFPNPSSGTAKIPYVRTPVTLASLTANTTEYPDLPTRFHRAPVMRAAALIVQEKRESLKEGQDPAGWLSYFDDMCEKLRQETQEQLRSVYRGSVPDVLSGQLDYWMEV